jgi:polyisoprenoid-binding protein YceI
MKIHAKFLLLAALAAGLVSPARAAVETYAIDPVHSTVEFAVKHFVGTVHGHFNTFSGTITVDRDNLENSSVEATIDVASISTSNDHRDADLKTPSYFDVEKFASMTFKSASWKKTGDGTFDVAGDLTIHGVTKQIVLKVTSTGFGPGMQGAQLSGWEAEVTLNRKDFGVNGPSWAGNVIGESIKVSISIEADLKK